MISICIPIYNFDVTPLFNTLYTQIKKVSVSSEIILIDDGSQENYRLLNAKHSSKATYMELEENIGRAAIRNLFLKHAQFDTLLFLDCDSIVENSNFLNNYFDAIDKYPDSVLCGGREYAKKPPSKEQRLRWKYGIVKESKPWNIRAQNPNTSFMTNNFVISREVFKNIQFNENLRDYGHEDTLFGFELKKNNIPITHINNPIWNGHLEDTETYLENTKKAIKNLPYLLEYTHYDRVLINDITLVRMLYKLKNVRPLLSFLFWFAKPLIILLLTTGIVNLYLFDFYKLGLLNKEVKRDL